MGYDRLVPSAVYVLGYADRLGALSLVCEFGRVMQDQNETIGGSDTITRRLKMTGQNVRLADPVIGEKAIGGLGVGPILANQRNALPHGALDLGQQLAEPLAKPRVAKFAPGGFSINPTDRERASSVDPAKPNPWSTPRSRIRCSAMNHKRFFRLNIPQWSLPPPRGRIVGN